MLEKSITEREFERDFFNRPVFRETEASGAFPVVVSGLAPMDAARPSVLSLSTPLC
jgi:hypothetical protein